VREQLTQEQFVAALDEWAGQHISARVVTADDDLVAVFRGQLGGRSVEKGPSLFWPVLLIGQVDHPEKPGVYLHPERFEDALIHEGGFVLELRQGGVTLNLRRLRRELPTAARERPEMLEGVAFGSDPGPGYSEGGG
jgi:hypothetical protein